MSDKWVARLKECGKIVGVILLALCGSGGVSWTMLESRSAQASDTEVRLSALEYKSDVMGGTLREMDQLLRQIDRNVSEMRGEMRAARR